MIKKIQKRCTKGFDKWVECSFGLFLCLLLLLSVGQNKASAVETGSCGDNLTYTLSNGTLSISGVGEMDIDETVAPWYSSRGSIHTVIIGHGVTAVDYLNYLTALTYVSLPNTLKTIKSYAFNNCSSLSSISLPDSLEIIESGAFQDCESLRSIRIPNSVQDLQSSCFANCTSLHSVSLGTGIKTIKEDLFFNCTALETIDIPQNVTTIKGGAFRSCSNLTNVTIPYGVTTIDSAFAYCTKLKSIYIPESVTELGTFYECEALESLVIPNKVTKLPSWAFCGCIRLREVILPSGLKEIGDGAFQDCISLKSLSIPDSVSTLGRQAFYNCENLETISIPNAISKIKESTFSNCKKLSKVSIGSGVTSIGSSGMRLGVFDGCDGLKEFFVDLGNRYYRSDSHGVLFGYLDGNSHALLKYPCANERTTYTIPSDVEYISIEAFNNCLNLESITFAGKPQYIYFDETLTADIFVPWQEGEVAHAPWGATNATIHYNSEFLLLNKETLILPIGGSETLVATISPEEVANKKITWSSDDKTVATVDVTGRVKAGREGITTITAQIGNSETWKDECKIIVRGYGSGVYSIGEETYCYHNIDGGCCFGMALTSSMYHLGLLDRPVFGVESNALYDCYLEKLGKKEPTNEDSENIHYFQNVQGVFPALSATVAGTIPGLNIRPHPQFVSPYGSIAMQWRGIEADWYQVKNYVKSHQFDNKGSLLISFELSFINNKNKTEKHQHTVNFLRYEEVVGQERIYTYDSNNPDAEMFFYQDIDGSIKHSNYSNEYTSFSVNSFSLEDVYKYANAAKEFKRSHAIYAEENNNNIVNIVVESALSSIMSGDFGSSLRQVVYEIPDDLTEVRIAPLTDHAEFTYMDRVYTIDREDENTIGILKLAESEDDTGTLTIINDPDNHVHVYEADSYTLPTCSEAGKVICKCTRCSDTVTETLDALGHYDNDDNNICDDCGKPMPATHTPGDINGDGVVNNKDLNRLMKKLAGENVECVDAALDVNGDGVVNNKDLNRLMKKLAGENVEIH